MHPEAGPLLRTEKLTKRYGTFTALDGLNCSVAPGEVVGLLGPNGSGKTTALRLVLGFMRPSAGAATMAGFDCWEQSVEVRRRIAYLPGELRLYESMTGRQIVRFLAELRGIRVNGDVEILARRFDVDVDRPLTNLSSGMKRKVALLTVLVPRLPLVIMDEPTNALDPTMRDTLLAQVRHAQGQGQAVLFSSHVMAEVERVCDRVLILRRGELVHEQDVSRLQEGRLVAARFAGEARRPPEMAGLRVRECAGDRLTVEHDGELAPLLAWLAGQPLIELRLEPLGLGAVYHRYHGNAE